MGLMALTWNVNDYTVSVLAHDQHYHKILTLWSSQLIWLNKQTVDQEKNQTFLLLWNVGEKNSFLGIQVLDKPLF